MPKTATFETNKGTIVADLYEKEAPITVENFEMGCELMYEIVRRMVV